MFFCDLTHYGEPLKEGSPLKWIFLTEIMYERDPDSVPKMGKAQQLAWKYVARAEEAETEGNVRGATVFYRKAYKLAPDLDAISIR